MRILLVLILLGSFVKEGLSQCTSKATIKSLTKASSELAKDGSIQVEILSNGAFECSMYAYSNSIKTLVEKMTDTGSTTLTFKNLANASFYKIDFVFSYESDPLCKSRVIDGIDLTGKRK